MDARRPGTRGICRAALLGILLIPMHAKGQQLDRVAVAPIEGVHAAQESGLGLKQVLAWVHIENRNSQERGEGKVMRMKRFEGPTSFEVRAVITDSNPDAMDEANRLGRSTAISLRRHVNVFNACAVLLAGHFIAAASPQVASAQEELWGEALIAKIDSIAATTLAEGHVAALSIGVKRGDDLLLAKGYGRADIENDVPATAETVYRIGSITKQFTAAAVMQLVESGKIGLDDPLTRYLPEYPVQGRGVTIRHLLTHTSGIKSYTSLPAWRPRSALDLTHEEHVALFQDEPFDFSPGERFLYNNSGFYLLGMIVEEVGGERYGDYLDTHIFGPLGLTDSSYCDERRLIRGRAEGYEVVDGRMQNDANLSMSQVGAAGALCSSVPDLLSWSAAISGGRVVSEAGYIQMTTTGRLGDGSETGYAFGLVIGELMGHPRVLHGGGINGFNAMLATYPETDLDVVVLSNTTGDHPRRIEEAIAKWALGIEVPVVLDKAIAPQELAAYEGVYELSPGFEVTVYSREGRLFMQPAGQGEVRLRAQGDGLFVPTDSDEIRVVFSVSDGEASGLVVHQGERPREATRVRSLGDAPVVLDEPLSTEDLATYAGVYEVGPGVEITISSRESRLFAQATGQPEVRLRFQGERTFVPTSDDAVRMVFSVSHGRADGLVVRRGPQGTRALRVR